MSKLTPSMKAIAELLSFGANNARTVEPEDTRFTWKTMRNAVDTMIAEGHIETDYSGGAWLAPAARAVYTNHPEVLAGRLANLRSDLEFVQTGITQRGVTTKADARNLARIEREIIKVAGLVGDAQERQQAVADTRTARAAAEEADREARKEAFRNAYPFTMTLIHRDGTRSHDYAQTAESIGAKASAWSARAEVTVSYRGEEIVHLSAGATDTQDEVTEQVRYAVRVRTEGLGARVLGPRGEILRDLPAMVAVFAGTRKDGARTCAWCIYSPAATHTVESYTGRDFKSFAVCAECAAAAEANASEDGRLVAA